MERELTDFEKLDAVKDLLSYQWDLLDRLKTKDKHPALKASFDLNEKMRSIIDGDI